MGTEQDGREESECFKQFRGRASTASSSKKNKCLNLSLCLHAFYPGYSCPSVSCCRFAHNHQRQKLIYYEYSLFLMTRIGTDMRATVAQIHRLKISLSPKARV